MLIHGKSFCHGIDIFKESVSILLFEILIQLDELFPRRSSFCRPEGANILGGFPSTENSMLFHGKYFCHGIDFFKESVSILFEILIQLDELFPRRSSFCRPGGANIKF